MHPPISADLLTIQDIPDGFQNFRVVFGPSPLTHGSSLSSMSSCRHASSKVGALYAYLLKNYFCRAIRFFSNGGPDAKAAAIGIPTVFPVTLSAGSALSYFSTGSGICSRLLAICGSRSLISSSDLITALTLEELNVVDNVSKDLTFKPNEYLLLEGDLMNRIVSCTLTNRQIYTVSPTDFLNQIARVFTNVYNIKRGAMIRALAVLAERLRCCPGSVAESNYDERFIRQDMKRQIVKEGGGVQELRSLNRRAYGTMGKFMVVDAEIMDFILETEEEEEEVEKL
ncbi:hypothetical protein BPAE_0030g00300 [Botrytis paeoniae]|uniref:Uncharacterized protein n=1 Tax=Botrytis paeoniae TaxID=278948 RepID=A0A4Z1FTV3_9HELO|nr:hypothetical protein BPAE_0030g00300 [Botrytis paeoniae]